MAKLSSSWAYSQELHKEIRMSVTHRAAVRIADSLHAMGGKCPTTYADMHKLLVNGTGVRAGVVATLPRIREYVEHSFAVAHEFDVVSHLEDYANELTDSACSMVSLLPDSAEDSVYVCGSAPFGGEFPRAPFYPFVGSVVVHPQAANVPRLDVALWTAQGLDVAEFTGSGSGWQVRYACTRGECSQAHEVLWGLCGVLRLVQVVLAPEQAAAKPVVFTGNSHKHGKKKARYEPYRGLLADVKREPGAPRTGDAPHHTVAEHDVRGHIRVLRDGRRISVKPHVRGKGPRKEAVPTIRIARPKKLTSRS